MKYPLVFISTTFNWKKSRKCSKRIKVIRSNNLLMWGKETACLYYYADCYFFNGMFAFSSEPTITTLTYWKSRLFIVYRENTWNSHQQHFNLGIQYYDCCFNVCLCLCLCLCKKIRRRLQHTTSSFKSRCVFHTSAEIFFLVSLFWIF